MSLKPRLRRVLIAALFVLLGPLALLSLLETAWFQRRVSTLVGEHGVALEWASLRCTWRAGQCTWRGVVVEYDGLRTSLDVLSASWAWRPLLDSRVVVDALEASGVTVERVSPSTAPDDGAPRSHALEALTTVPSVEVRRLAIDGLSVRGPLDAKRLELDGLRLEGSGKVGPEAPPSLKASLSGGRARVFDGADAGLDLELELGVHAAVEGRSVVVTADGLVARSAPAWPLPDARALAIDLRLGFDPAARRVDLELRRLSAFGERITGHAVASVPDEGLPRLEVIELQAALHPVLPLLQRLEPSLELADATLTVTSTKPPAGEQLGAVEARLRAGRLAGRGVAATDVTLRTDATLQASELQLSTELSLASLSVDAARATAAQVKLRADGTLRGATIGLQGRLDVDTLSAGPARVDGVALQFTTEGFDVRRQRGDVALELDARALDVGGAARTTLGPSRLALKASFAEQLTLALSGTPGRARVTHPAVSVETVPAPLTLTATLDERFMVTSVTASLPLRQVLTRREGGELRVGGVTHTVQVRGDPREAAALTFTVGLADVRATQGPDALAVASFDVTGTARVSPRGLERLDGTLVHAPLRAAGVTTGAGKLAFQLHAPPGEDATASLDGDLPPLTLHATARRRGRGLEASVRAGAASLGVLAPLWPAKTGAGLELDPATLGFTLDGAVTLADLARPSELSVDLDLTVPKLAAQLDARQLAARSMSLELVHRHVDRVDRGTLLVRVDHPSVEDVALDGVAEGKVTLSLDRARGKGLLRASFDTKAERTLALELSLRRERDGRLHHELDVDVAHLGAWAPLVNELSSTPPGLVLDELAAHLVSRGDTLGLLDADFLPAPDWRARSDTTFHAGLEVRHAVHHVDGEETRAPRISVAIDAGVLHGAVSLRANLEVPTLELDVGTQHVALTGVHQVLSLSSETDPDEGLLHVELDGTIDELEQNLWPPWQPSAVHLTVDGSVDRLASFEIEKLLLESPAAGTRLELSKRLRAELGDAQDSSGQRFRLDGTLTQDLSKLDGAPRAFTGAGTATVRLRVQSPDLALFRVRGKLELADAGVTLPAQQLVIDGATGSVPFEEAFTLDATRGAQLVVVDERAAFARARAPESQPFLQRDGLLSLRRVRWKDVELAPVVASLEIQQNRFSLSRLKAERGSARIAGQLFVDYRPGEEVITFRGTLTGLERKGGSTPLDANAAFTFVPRRLELDGRMQVVRTSKEHLLDLLDVLDPHQEVASLNQVRSALAFGYPREAQLDFSDGLLSMDIAFGGLAGLFELGTVRGVSLGPFLNRYLAPSLRSSP